MQAQSKGHYSNRKPARDSGIITSEVQIDNQKLSIPDKKTRVRKAQGLLILQTR